MTSIRTNWRLKLALTFVLTAFFCIPYFTLQRVVVFPVRTLPLTAIDRAIGFDASWVWVYQSAYLLLLLVPWMTIKREQLKRYAAGFIVVSTFGFLCFFFLPIRGPRLDDEISNTMFRLLVWYDRPLNCFPSLHVGLAVYTMLVAAEIFDRTLPSHIRTPVLFLGWLWTTVVAYAALATKQHYAIDLPAGALLAVACHWSTSHIAQRSPAHAQTPLGLSRTSVFRLVRTHTRRSSPDAVARRQ
jgi:membrane-associated phospholipid phosphatase